MKHKCEIKLHLTIYQDCNTTDEEIALYCMPEVLARAVADELTDDRTVVMYDYEYKIKEVS